MLKPRFLPVIIKQVTRRKTRTALTVLGVAMAMFLFGAVQALQQSVADSTESTGRETTLVVYRENRFCPFTSRLPDSYTTRIARIPGVATVVPMKIVVSNCQASLDVVTFRGVPLDRFASSAAKFEFLEGSLAAWNERSDAAIIGEALATRRGVKPGQMLSAAGVSAYIAGIIRSSEPQDANVAYVSLDFLQRTAARGGDGIVTQFNVTVDDPAKLESVASAIDEEFRHDPEPTDTRPEKAFVLRAAHDLVQIVGFTRYLGWAALAAVLALVSNAIVLSVQSRVKEHAILQTLGYHSGLIARMILAEGILLSALGGALGTFACFALLQWFSLSMFVEGTSMTIRFGIPTLLLGLAISAAVGILAGLVPAIRASRGTIAGSLRAE